MIPSPSNLSYLPFQKEIIHMLRKKDYWRTIISLPLGAGKTIVALGHINNCKPKTVLVVAPLFLHNTWEREAKKWLVDTYDIQIVNNKTKKMFESKKTNKNQMFIVNYEGLLRFDMTYQKWDMIFADEAVSLKNSKAKRTAAFRNLQSHMCYLITGTPLQNFIWEMFSPYNILKPHIFPNEYRFQLLYCDAEFIKMGQKQIWYRNGASNIPDLRKIVRDNHLMIYRRREQILADLPPITEKEYWLSKKCEQSPWYEKLRAIKDKDEKQKYITDGKVDLSGDSMFAVRKRIGLHKVEEITEIVESILEEKQQILLFCVHREVAEKYQNALSKYNPLIVHGGLKGEVRSQRVDDFIANKDKRVLIATIKSAGVGLTIVNTDTVCFLELPFTWADKEQAFKRIHRIGQDKACTIHTFIQPNSLDVDFHEMIGDKRDLGDMVLEFGE